MASTWIEEMDLSERLDRAVTAYKEMKENHVKESPAEPDMNTQILVFRGDKALASMGCVPNRDNQLYLLKMAIVGLSADEVIFCMESCSTTHDVNPGTGKRWESGEMQEVLRNPPDWYVEGMVKESLQIFAWNRAGDLKVIGLPFVVRGNQVEWLEEIRIVDEKPVDGFMVNQISLMWQDETLMERAIRELEAADKMPVEVREHMKSLNAEEQRAHTDVAVMKTIFNNSVQHRLPIYAGMLVRKGDDSRWAQIMSEQDWEVVDDISGRPVVLKEDGDES
jgi:hypothetical protein